MMGPLRPSAAAPGGPTLTLPSAPARSGRFAQAAFWVLSTLLALAATALMRGLWQTDGDVAWLLTAAERMLDGGSLYRDIIESNPPASVFLYVPAVLLARATGMRAETASDLLVTATVVLSLGGACRILARAHLLEGRALAIVWGMGLGIMLLLPLASFGQREQVVTAALLPILAGLATRRAGLAPSLAAIVLAGAGAGAAIAIKPIFALALVGPLLDLGLRGSWRRAIAVPEVWIAGVLAVMYALIVMVSVPAFAANVLPLVLAIYVPAHNPLYVLLALPSGWIWLAFVVTVWRMRRPDDALSPTLALASAGLMACFFIQAKGFPYHSLPAIVVAGLAVVAAVARQPAGAWQGTLMNAAPALLATIVALHQYAAQSSAAELAPGLPEALRAGPPVRRLLAINNDNEIGPVFARQIGADWVGSQQIAWVTLYASIIDPHPEKVPAFLGPIRQEQARYAADITRGRPDALLVEGEEWLAWVHRSPLLDAAFADYERAGRYGKTLLFRRKPSPFAGDDGLRPALPLEQSPPGDLEP